MNRPRQSVLFFFVALCEEKSDIVIYLSVQLAVFMLQLYLGIGSQVYIYLMIYCV